MSLSQFFAILLARKWMIIAAVLATALAWSGVSLSAVLAAVRARF